MIPPYKKLMIKLTQIDAMVIVMIMKMKLRNHHDHDKNVIHEKSHQVLHDVRNDTMV